jgi:hypothetical protein
MIRELVSGEKQLLSGGRCPRCFHPQPYVRSVHLYEGDRGSVVMYSCPTCMRPIGMEMVKPVEAKN